MNMTGCYGTRCSGVGITSLLWLVLITMVPSDLRAQDFWVKHIGSLGNDHINDVKVDDAGDIYVTGEFSGDADFGDSTFHATGGLDMFVAKLDPNGSFIWWKRCGGYGLDRGIKLAFGPGNTMAVVGEFMGDADFQGMTITSQNYTADMFIALLDRTSGAQQWVRQGGGAAGADRPYGVTIAPDGKVTVAGEFSGSASWSGFTLNSVPDPDTGVPTMDVVVVSYAADGTALWVQQGAAERNDRAIEVVNDPMGNIYVTGQFSDTVTFDAWHPNAMYNATFIIKLDPDGNEQWFRRCGGAIYDHVRDMLYTDDGELLLVGDLQGNMIFMDDAPEQIGSNDPYSYYVMRVDTAGQYMGHALVGSENLVSARSVDLRNDTLVVFGQFECRFTSVGDHYGGSGIWCAAGREDLFIAKHKANDLHFIEARHFSGSGEKLAGQVAVLPGGDIIACGSYARSIDFPLAAGHSGSNDGFLNMQSASGAFHHAACGLPPVGPVIDQDATGLKDGVLFKMYDNDSVTFDWFHRVVPLCGDDFLTNMCVREGYGYTFDCPDTVVFCGNGTISASTPFAPSYFDLNSVGPRVYAHWSTGDSALAINVTTSGTYWLRIDAANGCWSWIDTLVVIVNPMPPLPALSDDHQVNSASTQPAKIHLCDPETVNMWCANLDTSTTYFWTWYTGIGQQQDTLFTDTLASDTTHIYWFTMLTDQGCKRVTQMEVIDHPFTPLPPLTLDATITYPQAIPGTDSVYLCTGAGLQIEVLGLWSENGIPIPLPDGLVIHTNLNSPYWSLQDDPSQWHLGGSTLLDGWYVHDIRVLVTNPPCGTDSLIFAFSDSVWVGHWPAQSVSIELFGPQTMCVGDSALLTTTCTGCEHYSWTGPGLSAGDEPTAWATHEGNYTVHGNADDPHGCIYTDQATLHISFPDGPLLASTPADGIICPNASAVVYTTTPGTSQIWYGPTGPVPNNSQQVISHVPGEYYLTMVDTQGCFLTSDPLLLTGYGTPYLNVTPDALLCIEGDEVLVQVVTTVPSAIAWSAPLSGNALQQVITEPGTYSVTATACAITTELTVVVVQGEAHAEVIDPGPFTLCPGDSVLLQAVPGQATYLWFPGETASPDLLVTAPGEYVLQAIDANGCAATTAPVVVENYTFDEPLIALGDTICLGEQATLNATGSGTIQWFADATGQQSLATGATFTVGSLTGDTTFYVSQTDAQCSGSLLPVEVVVRSLGSGITFNGPTSVCAGGTITIEAQAEGATSYEWVTPTGPVTGASILLSPVGLVDAGEYSCMASAGSCFSITDTFHLEVVPFASVDLGPDVDLCPGGSVSFQLSGDFVSAVWNGAVSGLSFTTGSDGMVTVEALMAGGCSARDTVLVHVIDIGVPLSASDVVICQGEDAVFHATGSGTIIWSAEPDMDPVLFTGADHLWSQPISGATLYVTQQVGSCSGDTIIVLLEVLPAPEGLVLDAPVFTCEGAELVLSLIGGNGITAAWTTPTGAMQGTTISMEPFGPQHAGTYSVVPFLGQCQGDTLSTLVTFVPTIQFSLGPDTTFCIGGSVTLEAPGTHTSPMWSTGDQGYSTTVSTDGMVYLEAIDQNGCVYKDGILVTGVECGGIVPNAITPNGDGVNDSWTLSHAVAGFRTAELLVFSREGNKVFEADPSVTPFRGKNDSGDPLSEGVYYYVLRLFKLDNSTTERTGYIHVVR